MARRETPAGCFNIKRSDEIDTCGGGPRAGQDPATTGDTTLTATRYDAENSLRRRLYIFFFTMKTLTSVFTDDMDRCYLTGRRGHIERHHIFPGANRRRCELYGYVVPLHADIHPNGAFCKLSPVERRQVDHTLRQMAQRDYEIRHGSRADFIAEFGRSYLGWEISDDGEIYFTE